MIEIAERETARPQRVIGLVESQLEPPRRRTPAARAERSAPAAARRRAARATRLRPGRASATMEASVTSSPSPAAPFACRPPVARGGPGSIASPGPAPPDSIASQVWRPSHSPSRPASYNVNRGLRVGRGACRTADMAGRKKIRFGGRAAMTRWMPRASFHASAMRPSRSALRSRSSLIRWPCSLSFRSASP